MKHKTKILVTGAGSQLGKTLQEFVRNDNFIFDFHTKETLDITRTSQIDKVFDKSWDYCLNFAAYTDVNLAESEPDQCFRVNTFAVENLAKACQTHRVTLIHISTDYVFDGTQRSPYSENDKVNPLNIYGKSKWQGEEVIRNTLDKYLIIRTSWLYSFYNRNFVKTILRLADRQDKISLIADQTGTPTYAADLIDFILFVINQMEKNNKHNYYGTYHFSNSGEATWFDFGRRILELSQKPVALQAITSEQFLSPAKRPAYSVLSKNKIKKVFAYKVRHWEDALKEYFESQKSI
jgi:dTDP-4-dehydrorhamnose reductase